MLFARKATFRYGKLCKLTIILRKSNISGKFWSTEAKDKELDREAN